MERGKLRSIPNKRGKSMKKLIKISSVLFCIIFLCTCFVITVSAEIGHEGINYTIDSENYTATVYNCYSGNKNIVIPESVNGFTVVGIRDYAFAESDIESISLPDTLKTIGAHAFSDCTELQQITIPSSVTSIGDYVFTGCEKLENVEFFANINRIPMYSFENCTLLNQVSLAETVTEVGGYAFSGCSALGSFPFDHIQAVAASAFSGSGLQEVTLPATVSQLNSLTFANCGNLTYVEIPASVSYIAFNAFKNNQNMTLGVYYDSYAYNYAKNKSIPYVLLDGVKLGDASGDGIVNINDVTVIQRYLAELETLEGIYLHAADANQDGTVDIADATIIQMYLAEYEMEYPIGEVMTQ